MLNNTTFSFIPPRVYTTKTGSVYDLFNKYAITDHLILFQVEDVLELTLYVHDLISCNDTF